MRQHQITWGDGSSFPPSLAGPYPVASPPIHYANRAQDKALHLHVPAVLHLGFLVCEHGNLPGQCLEIQRAGNWRGLRRVRHRIDDFTLLRWVDSRSLLRFGEIARRPWRPGRRGAVRATARDRVQIVLSRPHSLLRALYADARVGELALAPSSERFQDGFPAREDSLRRGLDWWRRDAEPDERGTITGS